MGKLWKIKHWLKYEPSIAFWEFMAKVFHGMAVLTDKLGYLIFGKRRWERAKRETEEEIGKVKERMCPEQDYLVTCDGRCGKCGIWDLIYCGDPVD